MERGISMFNQRTVAFMCLLGAGTAGGEILIAPVAKDKVAIPAVTRIDKPEETHALRNKAKAYEAGNAQASSSSKMEGSASTEESYMLPGRGEMSTLNRARNIELSRDHNSVLQQPNGNEPIPGESMDTRNQLEKNSAKANQYMRGTNVSGPTSSSNEVVPCDGAVNVTGRIGDDSSSGNEIIIIRDHKKVRVHCK
jgi:hypothetical protein